MEGVQCWFVEAKVRLSRVYQHLVQRNEVRGNTRDKKRDEEAEGEEKGAGGGGGSIKESTLRYNKVHPWKPSALFAPAFSHFSPGSSSITPSNLLCSSTLLIFPSVLGELPPPLPRRPRWLYRESSRRGVVSEKKRKKSGAEGAGRGEEERRESERAGRRRFSSL